MNIEQEYFVRFEIILFTIILTFTITIFAISTCQKTLDGIKDNNETKCRCHIQ